MSLIPAIIKEEWAKMPSLKFAVLAAAALALLVLLWASMHQERTAVGTAMPAVPAPEVAHETKADTPIQSGTVKTYAPAVKRNLNLPPQVQADDTKQVLEASKVPADDHSQIVTTLVDTKNGKTETYVTREPLPWLAFDYTGDAGAYYGLRNGVKAFRLEARQSLFAVKGVRFGGIASFDQPIGGTQSSPSTFVGVGAWAHWQ